MKFCDRGMNSSTMKENFKLYRCIFLKEKKDYIIGKDVFTSKTYYIKKSKETEGFKIGTDNSFYATKEESGLIFKKPILNVVDFNKVVNNRIMNDSTFNIGA